MELTLDDYLVEFDRWKERAADKRKAREDAKQPAFNDESLTRMEKRIGQPLPRVASGEMPGAGVSAPGEPADQAGDKLSQAPFRE
ncbi:MAG TPA: hypothetical protein VFW87_06255 [Pirellulales bacterium]|nr:hypothetical protein [Pirellulales bacterium]